MKIVEIIPQLASGGAERFVVDLSNELSINHDVYLISFYDDEISNFYSREVSSKIKRFVTGKKRGFSIKLQFKIFQILKRINPDILHIHLDAINYVVPYLLFNKRCKGFMTIHNDAYKETNGFLCRNIRRFAFANNVITPVTISKESQRSFYDCYKLDSLLIFNGRKVPSNIFIEAGIKSEFKAYRKTPKTKVLVNLARFSTVKRQPLIAKCVNKLHSEGFDFTFLMIGQNRDQKILQSVLEHSCSSLYVLGEKCNPLEYLQLSDAFCLFSSYEGLPISLIEALATSTVPLCTPVGGILDIVDDGINGLLAKGLSEEDVYNTLKKFLLLDEDSLETMKKNAHASFKFYSIEETAKQYVEIFNLN